MDKLRPLAGKLLKNNRKLVFLVALIAIVGYLGWHRFIRPSTQRPQYQTAQVERGTIVSSVSASGQILSSGVVNVTTNASGIIKRTFVSDGEKVAKGTRIAEIELDSVGQQKNASAWSSYLSAKNSLDSASTSFYTLDSQMWAANQKLIKDAVARGLVAEDPTYIQEHDDWLAAEGKYKNQKNTVFQSQAALNNALLGYQQSSPIVTAPMSGIVENITIAPGMTIGQSTATSEGARETVAVIRVEGKPLGSFNFSELDIKKLKIGQKATITVDAIGDKTFTGGVVALDKIGQVVSNVTNYPVIIQLDSTSIDLLPNMSASASVIIEMKDNVIIVPTQAVQSLNDRSVVRVLKRGKIEQKVITTGVSGDQGIEIVTGLAEGDEVIIGMQGTTGQQGSSSPFGSFGGGVFRSGGLGGSSRGVIMQH